jgi:LysR family transcriptional regulator of gallate degradation
VTADTLRHLHVFHAVATHGGVRQACSPLRCAPSTVTRAIASLERIFAVTLFERTGDGMRLTAAGRQVAPRARRIEVQLGAVHAQACLMRRGDDGGAGLAALFSESRLRLAVVLAQEGRMAAAASACAVSQPAVSQAVTRLEADLGQPLFLRGARRMVPTEAGARWVGCFQTALEELRRLRAVLDVKPYSGQCIPGSHPGV